MDGLTLISDFGNVSEKRGRNWEKANLNSFFEFINERKLVAPVFVIIIIFIISVCSVESEV